ncbi:MAG: transporter substrate-binding domain-containing protein [Tabrizicola sp.]|nr:transporter substrate-binding domain-containing protein [Tabrizicola sp.]
MNFKTLTIALALLAAPAAAQEVKIGVAAEPYPPFASPDASGNWVGWEVDFINAVCAAGEMQCVITPVAWEGIIPSLTGGQIDAIMASMSITEERMKTIDFSDKYYNTPAVIITAKGSGLTPDAAGMAGKIIGVQVSTIHEAYAQKHFPEAAEIKTYQTTDEGFQDLAAGRIDASQADSIAIDAFLASDVGKACCEAIGAVADDPSILGLGVGVGLRKGEDELKAKFNAAIAKVIADGTYDEISKPYFASSIYGG